MKGIQIFAVKFASGSSSVQPVELNVDNEIKVADA